eukprot:m.265641 g.265641  ORF g.265641 m.265641 type:complete len:182 (-) comp29321_c0_seq1:118-663(-)
MAKFEQDALWLHFLVGALAVALTNSLPSLPSITGPPADTKPHTSWESFYSLYQKEHADSTCRMLHVTGTSIILLLGLFSRGTILALILSMCLGLFYAELLVGMPNGAAEGALLVLTFFVFNWLFTRSNKFALGMLLIGYGFAWAGHFFFEKNRPATFIYPAYSLISDFFMVFQIATGKETF